MSILHPHGATRWSYTPYRPFFKDRGDIVITRLAPDTDSVTVDFMDGTPSGEVLLRKRDTGDFAPAFRYDGIRSATVSGLCAGETYEMKIRDKDGMESPAVLFRCGDFKGKVINYLHPEDDRYDFSGHFLGSPSSVRQADGSILLSMDVFGNGGQNFTMIFRSDDGGESFQWQCDLFPCFWGRLFVYEGDTYMMACAKENGDLIIGRSRDFGRSFDAPAALVRGSSVNSVPGIDFGGQPPIVHGGRIWFNYHVGCWRGAYQFWPCLLSAPVGADLTDPAVWAHTPPCIYDPTWEGVGKGRSAGSLEGTFVSLDGELYMLTRYDMEACEPNYGRILMYRVNEADPEAPLTFVRAVEFPANHSRFTVLFDGVSGRFYTLASRITGPDGVKRRDILSLFTSKDCIRWELVKDIIDVSGIDGKKIGYQYVDFWFEGEDIRFFSRTAINGADTFHNSNAVTLHRIENFRDLLKNP